MSDVLSLDEKKALLKEIKKSLYEGALKVKFKDREIEYRTVAEMKQIISTIEGEIGEKPRGKRVVATFSRV